MRNFIASDMDSLSDSDWMSYGGSLSTLGRSNGFVLLSGNDQRQASDEDLLRVSGGWLSIDMCKSKRLSKLRVEIMLVLKRGDDRPADRAPMCLPLGRVAAPGPQKNQSKRSAASSDVGSSALTPSLSGGQVLALDKCGLSEMREAAGRD